MIKLSTIEIALGVVALTAASAGSFLIAGGNVDQLPAFVAISLSMLALTGAIVVSRVSQYRLDMRTRLFDLLPSERACEPDAAPLDSLVEDDLFMLIESHVRQQDALLSANCHALIQGQSGNQAADHTTDSDELYRLEDELRQLRAEISALEDQFRTDQSLLSPGFINAGLKHSGPINSGHLNRSGHTPGS